MRRVFRWLLGLGLIGLAAFWFLTAPDRTGEQAIARLVGDAERGAYVFVAGGCASCHADDKAEGDDKLKLGGGQRFPSPFGTFIAPNISSHPEQGIGGWSALDLVNALRHGTSPDGSHYFPAFPYASYTRMELQDMVDLHAYMMTLPAVTRANEPHEVGFPFNIRRTLGGWKLLFLNDDWVLAEAADAEIERGRYLVEALGHCGECHTSRNALGGVQLSRWLGGAPNPTGDGTIPNITPGKLTWSGSDIVEYLTSGFTPEFDTAGGHMVKVIENTAQLSEADRAAIVAYLKAVPAVE